MKTKAAIAWEAGKPLTIEEVDRPLCAPVCEKLGTYPAKVEAGRILIEV